MSSSEKIPSTQSVPARLPDPMCAWAGTRTQFPRNKTVTALFEEVVERYPDKLAIICDSERLTYRRLNERANQLAHRLLSLGVRPGSLVGLSVERSPELIVGILGILKTGAAYVPFDSAYPSKRLEYMREDSATTFLVLRWSSKLPVEHLNNLTLVFVDDDKDVLSVNSIFNPPASGNGNSLAYVMYTSGSSGRPKGVLVEHRSIVRLVINSNYCRFGPDEVFLQFAPISFDASTFEIWGALLQGATLALMSAEASSLEQLALAIRKYKVTTLWLTAGLFHLFVDERLEDLQPLGQLLAGGDVLSAVHVRRVLAAFPEITVINGYGPTEGTTFSCCYPMRNGEVIPDNVPIGRPISNTFVYILDENYLPVGIGETGELYVGGDGVARGYLNPGDSTSLFLADPFQSDPDARMYRTGDMTRWRNDGTIEFLGRKDNQIKISGYRIELGEVEAALLRHSGVRQAAVVASEGGSKRLAAYYTATTPKTISSRELKAFLSLTLPAYMLPTLYTELESLPLNPNGKVDRGALPVPAVENAPPAAGEPTNSLEQQVGDLWKRVLRLENVGMDDNFFDLGGDSLSLVAVHSRLEKLLQREIAITDLFEHTTVRSLSRHIAGGSTIRQISPDIQQQAQKQREAFAKNRIRKGGAR